MGDGIEGAKHIESISPRSGVDEITLKAPEETEKGLQHKMRGIDEVNVLSTLFCFL